MVSGPQESTDKDTWYLQAPKSPNVGELQRARQASSPGGPQHLLPGSGDKRQTWIMGFISGPGQNRKGTISSGSHSRTTQSSVPDSAVRQAVMSLCSPSQRGGAVLSQVGQGDFSTHQPQVWTFLFSYIQGKEPGSLLPFTAAAPHASLEGSRSHMAMMHGWLLVHGRCRSPSHGLSIAQLLACSQI